MLYYSTPGCTEPVFFTSKVYRVRLNGLALVDHTHTLITYTHARTVSSNIITLSGPQAGCSETVPRQFPNRLQLNDAAGDTYMHNRSGVIA